MEKWWKNAKKRHFKEINLPTNKCTAPTLLMIIGYFSMSFPFYMLLLHWKISEYGDFNFTPPSILSPIYLNGGKVEYVDSITYLGATIINKKGIAFSSSNDLTKFYRASNSILRAKNKPSEEVMLHLLYSSCVPVLTYACAVKEYPSRQMQDCCTAMNDALRFLFGYNRWESVRTLRQSFGYKSLVEMFHRAKTKFDTSLY